MKKDPKEPPRTYRRLQRSKVGTTYKPLIPYWGKVDTKLQSVMTSGKLLNWPDTVARRWQWAMLSTFPTVSTTTFKMASGTPSHHTTIIPDTEPHDQSLDLSAELFPGDPAPSWSSYLYYCTILWWLFPLSCLDFACYGSSNQGNGWEDILSTHNVFFPIFLLELFWATEFFAAYTYIFFYIYFLHYFTVCVLLTFIPTDQGFSMYVDGWTC